MSLECQATIMQRTTKEKTGVKKYTGIYEQY